MVARMKDERAQADDGRRAEGLLGRVAPGAGARDLRRARDPLGQAHTTRFSNENLKVKIDENVREQDVFVVQTACPPLSENIVELLILLDALKHSSARRVTAVLPYFPYARSDKKDEPRISITARLMADMVATAGADRVLTVDLHSPQIQGFFSMPADQLSGVPVLCDRLQREDLTNTVVVAADVGEAKDAGRFAKRLDLPIAFIDKRRTGDDEKARPAHVIGDVKGKDCLLVDDEIATGGTIFNATEFLLDQGARQRAAAVVHPVLSGRAIERLNASRLSRPARHQHDPDHRRQALAEDRDPVDRAAAGDGDHAHPRRPLGLRALRLALRPLFVRLLSSTRRTAQDGTRAWCRSVRGRLARDCLSAEYARVRAGAALRVFSVGGPAAAFDVVLHVAPAPLEVLAVGGELHEAVAVGVGRLLVPDEVPDIAFELAGEAAFAVAGEAAGDALAVLAQLEPAPGRIPGALEGDPAGSMRGLGRSKPEQPASASAITIAKTPLTDGIIARRARNRNIIL